MKPVTGAPVNSGTAPISQSWLSGQHFGSGIPPSTICSSADVACRQTTNYRQDGSSLHRTWQIILAARPSCKWYSGYSCTAPMNRTSIYLPAGAPSYIDKHGITDKQVVRRTEGKQHWPSNTPQYTKQITKTRHHTRFKTKCTVRAAGCRQTDTSTGCVQVQ